MNLPDISQLSHLLGAPVAALRARFDAIGLNGAAIAPYAAMNAQQPALVRAPARNWHLRRLTTPLGAALRLFVFMDPVTPEEATFALGDAQLLRDCQSAGLLVPRQGGVVCPWFLNFAGRFPVISDDLGLGGEAVMGAGRTTENLIQAAWPARPIRRALDMGCGAGTGALLLTSCSETVVGVDINPRAVALAQFNTALAGAERLEFRLGDLFQPVSGEQFDLIISQPPFVPKPQDASAMTFLYGGSQGNELALQMVQAAPKHLAPGGRAVLLVDWPGAPGELPTPVLRQALGSAPCDLLVLLSTSKNLDEYVTAYAAAARHSFGPDFEDQVLRHRQHLCDQGIEEMRMALVVIRNTPKKPWTTCLSIRSLGDVQLSGAQVDRLLFAQDLLHGSDAQFRLAQLRIPEGARFAQGESSSIRVELPPTRLIPSISCSRAAVQLIEMVTDCASVEEALQRACTEFKLTSAEGQRQVLAGIRDALATGLLEVPIEASA